MPEIPNDPDALQEFGRVVNSQWAQTEAQIARLEARLQEVAELVNAQQRMLEQFRALPPAPEASTGNGHDPLAAMPSGHRPLADDIERHQAALRADPDDVETLFDLGATYSQLGRFEEAIETWQQVLQVQPDNVYALVNVGGMYSELGQWLEAAEAFGKAVRGAPNLVDAQYGLGMALAQLGQYDSALETFHLAAQLQPENAQIRVNMGVACAKLNRWEDAIPAFQEATRLEPDEGYSYYGLGSALTQLGHYEPALDAFRHAIRVQPGLADAHYGQGMAHLEMGQIDEAIAAFQHALRIQPDHANAHHNLKIAQSKRGAGRLSRPGRRQARRGERDVSAAAAAGPEVAVDPEAPATPHMMDRPMQVVLPVSAHASERSALPGPPAAQAQEQDAPHSARTRTHPPEVPAVAAGSWSRTPAAVKSAVAVPGGDFLRSRSPIKRQAATVLLVLLVLIVGGGLRSFINRPHDERVPDTHSADLTQPSKTTTPGSPQLAQALPAAGMNTPARSSTTQVSALIPTPKKPAPKPSPAADLTVYVGGAIRKPGLYVLSPGSNLVDAILKAGGTAENADLTGLFLPEPLHNGQQILVPAHD